MVINGETKPDAHAAAVRSDVTRHGRLAVFHFESFSGKAFEAMLPAFGEKSGGALSLSDFGGPLPSTSRVMTSHRICWKVGETFEYVPIFWVVAFPAAREGSGSTGVLIWMNFQALIKGVLNAE